jgi:protein-tyrosine phosphatase
MSEAVAPPKILPLDGGHNFREVGGYRTADGRRRLRRGRLWRSAALDQLSPSDCEHISALGIRAIADLRSDAERRRAPTASCLADGVRTLIWSHSGGHTAWGHPSSGDWAALSPEALHAEIARLYVRIADAHAAPLRDIIELIADGEAPLLVHCTAGKDRTGLVIAILLELAGVARELIFWDYEQTARHLDRGQVDLESLGAIAGPAGLAGLSAEAKDLVLGVDRSYLAAAITSLEDRFGSIEGFARGLLGAPDRTLTRFRSELLERI